MKSLITGHAHFATGLKSALELIAGPQENIEILEFTESSNLKDFQESIMEFCKDSDEESFIFTDLLGGTPFNMAMTAKGDNEKIHVFTGTNLPILLEFLTQQMLNTDIASMLSELKKAGQEALIFDLKIGRQEVSEESDGI